jgi:hypothetical protein
MINYIFNAVYKAVKEWIPERKYAKEDKYRDDLMRFLKKTLSSEDYAVKKGAFLDIAINDDVEIELKRNLKSENERKRLIGQIHLFMEKRSHAIIVLCGDVEQKTIEILNNHFKRYTSNSRLVQNKILRIIPKDTSKTRREKNESNPLLEKVLKKHRFSLQKYMKKTQKN